MSTTDLYKLIKKRTVTLTYNIITNIHTFSVLSDILYNDISPYFLVFYCHEIGSRLQKKYTTIC